MRAHALPMFLIVALLLTFAPALQAQMQNDSSPAQETVEESSTGKSFPAEVSFNYDGADYTLSITGTTVRKKYIVAKVYGIAHYMQDAAKSSREEAFAAALSDEKAKQITMDFARNVEPDKIQGAYHDGFKKNATDAELKEIQAQVDQFVGYFDKEVKENEQYVLRWLPGGIVLTTVQGEEKPAITSTTFARVLWSIWLGKDSIVDRNKLVSIIASE